MAKAKIGVVLSGCGYLDGAEIHESVLVLLAVDRLGAEAVCFAPDIAQADVVDHRSGKPVTEKRSVLAEAARIARGAVQDLRSARAEGLDALILPGGYGAAKNLSTFAADGPSCKVLPELERLLKELHAAGKPIGALCIAPAVVARALGEEKPLLTIGDDAGTAKALEAMGAKHERCGIGGVVVDSRNALVSTPAYMLSPRISELAADAEKLVAAVLELVRKKKPEIRSSPER